MYVIIKENILYRMGSANGKETRYFLADKQSWSDVTSSVVTKKTPKPGDVINVGKIKMTVKDVQDGSIHGRPIVRVTLESLNEPYTVLDEALSDLENPTIIDIQSDADVQEALGSGRGRVTTANTGIDNRVVYDPAGPRQDVMMYGGMYAAGPGTHNSMGGIVRSALNMGSGYGVSVADFGEVCTVTITYSNAQTGRSASQSFAIIYRGKFSKVVYTAYSNANRYRNCSDLNAAISYIRSKASSLSGSTSGVL